MSNEKYWVTTEDKENLLEMIKPFIHSEKEIALYDCIEQNDAHCSPSFVIIITLLESIFPTFISGFHTNMPKEEFLKYLMSVYVCEKYDCDDKCIPAISPMRMDIMSLNEKDFVARKIIHTKDSQYVLKKMDFESSYTITLFLMNTNINAKNIRKQPTNGKIIEVNILDLLKHYLDLDYMANHFRFYSTIYCFKIE